MHWQHWNLGDIVLVRELATRATEATLLLLALVFMIPPVGSRENLEYLGNPYGIGISIALFFGSRLIRSGLSKKGFSIAFLESLAFAAFHYFFLIAFRLLCA